MTNPGDNAKSFATSSIDYIGLVCNNGNIYSNGNPVYIAGQSTDSLKWEGDYYVSLGTDGSKSRTQIIDEVKVNTSESVVAVSYSTNAINGTESFSSPNVLLIPLDAGTNYMYHYYSYIDNQSEGTFYDVTNQATPRLLTENDLATEGVRVNDGTTTVTLPVSLAYDMQSGQFFDFYSYLNYYYALDPSRVSVTIVG